MSPFTQSLSSAQIPILELFHIFPLLKFSSFLTLAKIEQFSKACYKVRAGNIVPLFEEK
jgi:hypothetical protein